MENALISPKDGTEAVSAQMSGYVRMEKAQFGELRRERVDANGDLHFEYKYKGVWYITDTHTKAHEDHDARHGIANGTYTRSPIQE